MYLANKHTHSHSEIIDECPCWSTRRARPQHNQCTCKEFACCAIKAPNTSTSLKWECVHLPQIRERQRPTKCCYTLKTCPVLLCQCSFSVVHARRTHSGKRGEVVWVQPYNLEGASVLIKLRRQFVQSAVLKVGLYDVALLGLFLSLSILLEPPRRHPEDRLPDSFQSFEAKEPKRSRSSSA